MLGVCLACQATAAVAETPHAGPATPVRKLSAEPPQVRAAQRFLARRGGANQLRSRVLASARQSAAASRRLLPMASGTTSWTAAGPLAVSSLDDGLVTGRISSIALDPSDSSGNTVYLGTTGGGVWKSQNAAASAASGVQFTPLTDGLAALASSTGAGVSVGAVSVQPGGTGILLAGLGDPNDALDSYYGAGLLRSTDNGKTWSLITQTNDLETGLGSQDFSFTGEGFAGFAWSTVHSQLVVAAVSQAFEGAITNAGVEGQSYEGLYWSNDAGATWHLARIADLDGQDVQGPLDAFILPDGNAATSVVWNPVRQLFFAAVRYHGYYQSSDGINWTRLANQPGSGLATAVCPTGASVAGCPIFRGTLAVNPQTGDTFAWTVDAFNQDQGIWQDQCAIAGSGSNSACGNATVSFATRLASIALETADDNGPATIENGDYNLTLTAVPAGLGGGQDTLLFAGDNDLWKCSLADGCVWRNSTNATTCMSAQVSEYQHALAWNPGNPLLVFDGTDGGLWRSIDQVGETGSVCSSTDASHWQNLNGALGSLAEVESLGQSSATAATMLAGLGAQGSSGIVNAPAIAGDWNQVLGGEGGPVAVTPGGTQNNWYVNNGAGVSIYHCSSAAGTLCTASGFGSGPVIGESQAGNDGLTMTEPAAFRVDALDSTQLLIGTCRVWRGVASGAGWSGSNAISPILDNGGGTSCNGDSMIRSLGALITTSGSEVIYAGMAGFEDGGVAPGRIYSATIAANGTIGAWTDQTASLVTNSSLGFNPQGADISSIYVDPHDTSGQTVYVTISAFSTPDAPVEQVYRSTNGGATWISITSNLPNAPANAVTVDAQNPATVYAGTDAGVFVTTTVGSCGAAGIGACWAAYGTGLPLAPVTTLLSTSVGAVGQVLTAGTYGRGIWQVSTLGAGTTLTTATASPTTLTFAATTIGAATAAQTVTLKNTGAASLTVSGIALSGSAPSDFAESDNCTGVSLSANATCAIKVTFAPSQTGSRAASLAIEANISGGQILVPLTGTGQAAGAISLNPTSVSFAIQQTATISAAQNISVQNTGGSTVSISSITVTAPFKLASKTCGSTLTAATACALTVTFAPTQAGLAAGTVTVADSAGTQTAQLSGTGVLGPTDTLSVSGLSFPATVDGQISAPLTVTLTNSGGLSLTSISTSVTSNQGSSDFQAVSNCGSQLAANLSCSIAVTLTPSIVGSETGTLYIGDALKSQSVKLAGSGQAPPVISLSSTSFAFGSEEMGVPSTYQLLKVSNTGGSPLALPTFSFSGLGAAAFSTAATTCTVAITAGSYCLQQVIFTPVIAGAVTATMTVSSTSPGVVPKTVALSGTGLTPPVLSVQPASINVGTVDTGFSSNAFTVQITNLGQTALTTLPSFALTGFSGPNGSQPGDFALSAPSDVAACTTALNPGASCYEQIIFSPSGIGAESVTLVVTDAGATPSTATVTISGTGAPPIALESNLSQLEFGQLTVGATSAPMTLSLSNVGRQPANGLTLTLTGSYSLNPTLTTCGGTLGGAASCTVGIVFSPTASGDQPGTLTVAAANLGVTPLVISLDGTAVSVGGFSVKPSQFTFGSVQTGTNSTSQELTITNSGGTALAGVQLTLAGDFALTGNSCPTTLAAGASCTTGIVFKPSTTGNETSALTLSSTSAGAVSAVVPLSGTGVPAGTIFANPTVLGFGSVTVGQSGPTQTVTLQNAGATTFSGLGFTVSGDYSVLSNSCGTTLASTASCTLNVSFAPSQAGTRIGSVTVTSTATGFIPVVVGLTGTGVPAAQLTVTPLQLSFAAIAVGASSTPQTLAVSNPGTAALQGLAAIATGPFSIGSGSCGATLAAGTTCSLTVTFAPKASGSQSGTVTVSSTSIGVASVVVQASGIGIAPASLALTPSPVNFPSIEIGSSSIAQTVTVTNSGGQALSGLALSISGGEAQDFLLGANTCTTTLAAGASCGVSITFTPSVSGGRQSFLIASSATTGVTSVTATLSGTGLAPPLLSFAPSQLSFATTQVGQTSPGQLLTLSNSGQVAIGDLQLTVSAGFAVNSAESTCTGTLAAGASCVASLQFSPETSGAVTGAISATSRLTGASATAALSGTGSVPPGIVTSPANTVQFGTTGVGASPQQATVTVANPSTAASLAGLTITLDTAAQQNGFALGATTCESSLAPGASCTVNLSFSPTTYGPLTGALTLEGSNGAGAVRLQLAGIGYSFQFAVSGNDTATVIQGQTADYTFSLTSLGSAANSGSNFIFACNNLPANAICVFNPSQLAVQQANVTGQVLLQIGTGAPSAVTSGASAASHGNNHLDPRSNLALFACGALVIPFSLKWRKKLGVFVAIAVLLGGIAALTGCAASSGGSTSGQQKIAGGTPPGSYLVTITASANGVTKNITVTLAVD